jgi:predicted dehydrogenase
MGSEPRLLIAETMIHQLDVLRALLGRLHVIAARALRTEPDMPGETLATILLETERGAPVVLSGSFVAPGFGAGVSDRLELIGSRSSVLVDGMRVESRGAFVACEQFDAAAVYQECFDRAAALFAHALLTGTEFPETVEGNLETFRLVEEAYRAAGFSRDEPATAAERPEAS